MVLAALLYPLWHICINVSNLQSTHLARLFFYYGIIAHIFERSSLPSKNFLCISMYMLQIGALVLVGRRVEAVILPQGLVLFSWRFATICEQDGLPA